jgi:hypothetical protein
MASRRVLRAVLAAAPIIGWVPFAAAGAGAFAGGAVCHASNGTTQYEFDGSVEADGSTEGSTFGVVDYSGEFGGTGTDLPIPAKNDFGMAVINVSSGSTVYSTATPDSLNYGQPYTFFPQGWNFPNEEIVFGRFTPAFDKRGTPDAHCTADTNDFTGAGSATPSTCPDNFPLCHQTRATDPDQLTP